MESEHLLSVYSVPGIMSNTFHLSIFTHFPIMELDSESLVDRCA